MWVAGQVGYVQVHVPRTGQLTEKNSEDFPLRENLINPLTEQNTNGRGWNPEPPIDKLFDYLWKNMKKQPVDKQRFLDELPFLNFLPLLHY